MLKFPSLFPRFLRWSEGKGLGKAEQGRTDIVSVSQRNQAAGLGMADLYVPQPGESYMESVQNITRARYNQNQGGW